MSLINHSEIIEQNENLLKTYLLNDLKESCNWQENSNDSINAQYNFFKTYYLNEPDSNQYINNELLKNFLKEVEKKDKLINIDNNTNFIDLFTNDEIFFYNADNIKINLLFYKGENNELNNINIFLNENSEIEIDDINTYNYNNDLNLSINNFKIIDNNILLNDDYNLYHINNQYQINKIINFDKKINFISNENFLNYFFIITSFEEKNTYINLINYYQNNFNTIIEKKINKNIKGGLFLNDYNKTLIYNKKEIFLNDFRTNNNNNSPDLILFNNSSYNINNIILLEEFNYSILSQNKISLFDLRYPSLPISEQILNLNYFDINIKKIINEDFSYLLYDSKNLDQSFLKIKYDINKKLFCEKFIEFKLFVNKFNLYIKDCCGFINDNNLLYFFYIDNFNGVYLDIYDLNINNYDKKEIIKNFKNNNFIENSQIKSENKSFDSNLIDLYKKYYINNIIYNNNKDNVKYDDFGTVKLNDKNKKLFSIIDKREFLENILENKSYNKIKEAEENNNLNNIIIANNDNNININNMDVNKDDEEEELKLEERQKINFLIESLNLSKS
jgi:hypothetical protein